MAGIGVYHMTEGDGTGETAGGLNAGLGINLTTHLSVDLRYHWVLKSDLARGMLPLSLTWNR